MPAMEFLITTMILGWQCGMEVNHVILGLVVSRGFEFAEKDQIEACLTLRRVTAEARPGDQGLYDEFNKFANNIAIPRTRYLFQLQ